ncbi:MAG: hypothetical protein ABR574_07295 [Cryomorphaceae bacterium]|nr:hypothetical protein [Flavobacteriales bacterium]
MSSKEILLEKIRAIDDKSILDELLRIIDLELELIGDTVELSQSQKDFVEEGLREYGEGKTIPQKEVKRRTREWLRKK